MTRPRFSALSLDFILECGTDRTFRKAFSNRAYSPVSFLAEDFGRLADSSFIRRDDTAVRSKQQGRDLSMYASFYQLREEARESWDYVMSNKFVYLVDAFDVALDSFIGVAKDYVEGNVWVEGHLIIARESVEENCHYSFIVECCIPQNGLRKPELNMAAMHRDSSVLVDVTQEVQARQKMTLNGYGVPSIVRLKRFDDSDCIGGNAGSVSREFFSIGSRKSRELSSFGIGGGEACQTPNELVERRTQAIQCVTGNERNAVGSRFNLACDSVEMLLRVGLTPKLIRLGFVEAAQLLPQSVEVFLRPLGLKVGVSQSDSHAEC